MAAWQKAGFEEDLELPLRCTDALGPLTDHEGVGYQHEGEEFVYVLAGSVEITVGDHVNKLAHNESLHFNSGISHNLKNVGESIAKLLVVIYGP